MSDGVRDGVGEVDGSGDATVCRRGDGAQLAHPPVPAADQSKSGNFWAIAAVLIAIVSLVLSGIIFWEQRAGSLADYRDRVYLEISNKTTLDKIKDLEDRLRREKIGSRQNVIVLIKAEYEDLLRKEQAAKAADDALRAAKQAAAQQGELERLQREAVAARLALRELSERMARERFDRNAFYR